MNNSIKKTPEQLRSYRWLGPDTLRAFGHRSRLKQLGYDDSRIEGLLVSESSAA